MTLHERLLSRLREELAEAEKATPGPWEVKRPYHNDNMDSLLVMKWRTDASGKNVYSDADAVIESHEDALFCARSRTLLPALLRGLIVEVEGHSLDPGNDDFEEDDECFACPAGTSWPCAAVRRWADVMQIKEE